ncbi:MAG: phosphoglycerate kinase [Myxococcota bacterium]|nr:phosphoglycerate kinase [Myxococcota bacterium]
MAEIPIPKMTDLALGGKRVLIRVDFNVPLSDGVISDDTRIRAALPTIEYAIENNARVILMSHLGRPKGTENPIFSLDPVATRLAELLKVGEVTLTDACVGDGARRVALDLRDGQVALLENLRFHPGETENDPKFTKALASLGEVYINDAFGTAHRSHASVVGVPAHLRKKAAGFLLEKEIAALSRLMTGVEQPYVAVLGGAKVSDKIEIIKNLINRVDCLIIGGAMANTFAAAKGGTLGASLVEADKLALARDLLARSESEGVKLIIPSDVVAATSPDAGDAEVVPINGVPADKMALDIGPDTRAAFKDILGRAKTIFWNGPMGMFEAPQFAAGTIAMARTISGQGAFSVVGGGDSVAAVRQAGLEKGFDHVSTGGGASLKFLEGKVLPGIAALQP